MGGTSLGNSTALGTGRKGSDLPLHSGGYSFPRTLLFFKNEKMQPCNLRFRHEYLPGRVAKQDKDGTRCMLRLTFDAMDFSRNSLGNGAE